jgi:hypothetical protein
MRKRALKVIYGDFNCLSVGETESPYHSKYGKFSSTFTKPLGISAMNFKLA